MTDDSISEPSRPGPDTSSVPSGVSVRLRDVYKSYRDGDRRVDVLAGVDLDIAPGEMIAVVGPSGSGKSTLLHLLGALDRADSGTLRIGDVELASKETIARSKTAGRDREELARFRNRSVGFVFQFHRLLPDFDALENVMLPGRIAGLDPEDVHDRARSLLVEVGLENRLDHFPGELSGGERQRVAICRALVLEPPLLLADEPTGSLDPASADHVFDLLLALQERHRTTSVLVTHNRELAARCARISSLENGRLESETI